MVMQNCKVCTFLCYSYQKDTIGGTYHAKTIARLPGGDDADAD